MNASQDKPEALGTNRPSLTPEADDDVRFDYELRNPLPMWSAVGALLAAGVLMAFALWLAL